MRLLKRRIVAISESRARSSSQTSQYSRSASETSARSSESWLISSERRIAAGSGSPGFRLAAARTKARARSKASVETPSQTCDQRMWEIGVIDSLEIVEKGVARTCSTANSARDDEAGRAGAAHPERVPGALRLELDLVAAGEDQHLVAGLGVGGAAQGGQEGVGVAAVGDGRRLLLEARRRPSAGSETAATDLPMSPPVPTSEVIEAISSCSSTTSRR